MNWEFGQKKFKVNYFAFEPEEVEAFCCDINVYDGQKKTQTVALWNQDTVLEFYSKPNSADSSVIEINNYSSIKRIDAIKLDTFVKKQNIHRIKLLKIEAEGAEPEVLHGAKNTLKITDYVTVDCGFERGIAQSPTFNEVNKILQDSGFTVLRANLKRMAFLYSRR